MMLANLKHMGKSIGICFPASTDEVNRAIIELKRPYDTPSRVRITDTDSPISNLTQCIKCADLENEGDVLKLNQLAAKIDGIRNLTGLIDLSFCCEGVTVITDFSNLETVGKHHCLICFVVDSFDSNKEQANLCFSFVYRSLLSSHLQAFHMYVHIKHPTT